MVVALVGLVMACAEAPTVAESVAAEPVTTAATDCEPGGPCSTPLPVRMVVVAMFERGAPSGDEPGEFQFWKERLPLDERIPFPHGHHDLYWNAERGILGFVTGIGTMHSAATTMALGLDQRFDLSQAYWLVAGIAGIDPEDASLASAAWSAYLVDGDLGHEIDPREMPEDWDFGYFPRHTTGLDDPVRPQPKGELLVTNMALRDWAFAMTKDIELPDSPELKAARSAYTEHPNALKPPFVLTGGHIAAMTFWHGQLLNDWANAWVNYWTEGATDFVTSAMEDTGTFQAITYLDRIGRVDRDRFLVLRAGSNYTMPPPQVGAAENLLNENKGYAGFLAALESLYLVGLPVVEEISGNWARYANTLPSVDDVASAPAQTDGAD